MPAIATSSHFLNGVPVTVIVFSGRDGPPDHKGIPQTAFPMLGLGAREDGSEAHSYVYQHGTKIARQGLRWDIPPDSVIQRQVRPNSPLDLKVPESTSTFSALAIGAPEVRVEIDQTGKRLIAVVDRTAELKFALFEGAYFDWKPIPLSRYAKSSSAT